MSKNNSNCVIFAGPTMAGLTTPAALKRAGITALPPVKRGDVEQLVSAQPVGTMLIVDGQFQQCLSVGHAEIRSALAAGWQVWGLSSMGAIRAYEMREMGVRGFGSVYEFFCKQVDFRDDEVALLHESGPSYRSLSEPLVHLRVWLRELRQRGFIKQKDESHVLHRLMKLWFGERTIGRARSMVLELIPKREFQIDESLTDFERYGPKTHALRDFLRDPPGLKGQEG